MNILHINIGRAPFYNGGSVIACEDLMMAQIKLGFDVSFMYPGHSSLDPKTRISSQRSKDAVKEFEIINPLPVFLMSGIGDPKPFLREADPRIFTDFFIKEKIEIIHIHSLMGIHEVCFQSANKLGIKLVFTTHDYFPMCPRCTLIDVNGELCESHDSMKCTLCNQNAGLPPLWEKVNRASSYRYFKHSSIFKILRQWGRQFLKSKQIPNIQTKVDLNKKDSSMKFRTDFEALILRQERIMGLMEVIHCNSEISKNVYLTNFPNIKTVLIPLAQPNLEGHDVSRSTLENRFRIGYVGGNVNLKGIETLMMAFKNLPESSMAWQLVLWGDDYTALSAQDHRILNQGRYSKSQLETVFSSMDVLVVPSIWPETFGFVVEEALAYGIPVLCSSRVGAKILVIDSRFGLVFDAKDYTALSDKIIEMSDPSVYSSIIDDLHRFRKTHQFDHYVKEMTALFQSLLTGSTQ